MRERQLNEGRRVPAPSCEQIRSIMSALCLTSRALGFAFGHPAYVIDCWKDGRQTPNDEDSSKLWKLFFLPSVQKTQPGVLRVVVVPPLHSKQRE